VLGTDLGPEPARLAAECAFPRLAESSLFLALAMRHWKHSTCSPAQHDSSMKIERCHSKHLVMAKDESNAAQSSAQDDDEPDEW